MYPEHAEGIGPDVQLIHDSHEVEERSSSSGAEEHRPITTLVPAINVTTVTPPLSLRDTAAVVEQNIKGESQPSASSNSGTEAVLGDVISLTRDDGNQEQTASEESFAVKRHSSQRQPRSRHKEEVVRQRSKSSDRSFSDSSFPTKTNSPSSAPLSRKSIDTTSMLKDYQTSTRTERSPDGRKVTANKSPLSNNTIGEVGSSDSEDDQTVSSLVTHKLESRSLASSKSSNSSLSSLATAEERHTPTVTDQSPCSVGEKIMVDTPSGFKFGKVKFVGSTEFAAGEWIGIALERPNGEWAC